MQILWKGQSCFSIASASLSKEQVKILMDPFNESIGLKLSPQEADIILVSHDHPDHSNKKIAKGTPFIIENPGEYEVKGVFVRGISSYHDDVKGKERGLNTIYIIQTEGITLCHLGDFGQKELTPEQVEQIGTIDILFIPVGGVYTLDAEGAMKIINQLEPKIAIPMHYVVPGLKVKLNSVDEFLKAMGKKGLATLPKIALKAKDIAGEREEVEIMVLDMA